MTLSLTTPRRKNCTKYTVSEVSNRTPTTETYSSLSATSRAFRRFTTICKKGLHPFYLPLAIRLSEDRVLSTCIRCNTSRLSLVNAKSDADISCVRPATEYKNLTLLTEAKFCACLLTRLGWRYRGGNSNSRSASFFYADIVVVACGAINPQRCYSVQPMTSIRMD